MADTKTGRRAEPRKVDLFAFWNYDTFPVLGAPVTRLDAEGKAYAPSYQGWVRPILMLPREAGEVLNAQLDRVRKEYQSARDVAERKMRETVNQLLTESYEHSAVSK